MQNKILDESNIPIAVTNLFGAGVLQPKNTLDGVPLGAIGDSPTGEVVVKVKVVGGVPPVTQTIQRIPWVSAGNVTVTPGTTQFYSDDSNPLSIGAPSTITLPPAAGYSPNKLLLISDAGLMIGANGTVTLTLTGEDTFGVIAPVITFLGGWVILQSDGISTWRFVESSVDVEAAVGTGVGISLVALMGGVDAAFGVTSTGAKKLRCGQVTLSAGTSGAISVADLTTASFAVATLKGGTTALTTVGFKAVPGTGTLTITAIAAGGGLVNTDTSIVSWIAIA